MTPTGMPGVLIAEDDGEIRRLLALLFRLEGYEVFEAEDGTQALSTFSSRSAEIRLIITDLGLPGIGGVELIGKIRMLSPSVKIIGASGFGKQAVMEDVKRSGADGFLAKPFNTEELLVLCRSLLNDGKT